MGPPQNVSTILLDYFFAGTIFPDAERISPHCPTVNTNIDGFFFEMHDSCFFHWLAVVFLIDLADLARTAQGPEASQRFPVLPISRSRRSSRSSNRVRCFRYASLTVSVGPLRCLAIMISAIPASLLSG